ncbi:MAG: DUF1631 family protein [Thiotrichales bacterium]|nr:MAG: DUF1631 family protein [Thiotrichales bacterium]
MSAQIHTLKTGDPADNRKTKNKVEDHDALINSIFNRLNVQLLQRVSDMLDNADSSLNMLSETAESKELKAKYQELTRLLRNERGNIDRAFFIAINDKINDSAKTETDELALVDQDEMEEMVVITSMYSNAMNNYGQEVNNLEARFEYLEMHSNTKLPKYAIDPKHICEAFQASLKQVEISLEYKLLLFKLFDMEVSSRLGDMYKSLNQIFIDADIMPEVVYKARNLDPDDTTADSKPTRPAEHKDFTVREAKYYDPQQNKSTNFVPRSQEEIGYFISQFMNGFTTASGEGIPESFSTIPSDKDNYNCFSRNDLMTALSKLQNKVIKKKKTVAKIDAEQIKRAIVADMGSSKGGAVTKRVHVLDQRNIDFVGMMFKEITNDESISKIITNLLMLLQIPVIKAAMLDEKLFTQEDHPARTTLDLISRAGKGVTDEKDHVFIKLEKIVDSILQEYDVDIASFERAVEALQTLISIEEEIAAENERIEQLEIIKDHARDVVLTEMRHMTSNKKLPKKVQPLILKHWPTMMCNRYVNHGKESHEWLVSLMLLKLLMKCLQPIKSGAQWEMLYTNHQPLVEAVNDELYDTQQDREAIDAQIAALKQTFLKMLDDYGYKLVEEPAEETAEQATTTAAPYVEEENIDAANDEFEEPDHNEEIAKIEEQTKIAREKIARLPSDLHPGVWFEIFNGKDKPIRRLKLSVILTEVAKLIFVDCHGVKVIEKDAGDFANELEKDQSRLLADHSTFEHALGTVIHKLAA